MREKLPFRCYTWVEVLNFFLARPGEVYCDILIHVMIVTWFGFWFGSSFSDEPPVTIADSDVRSGFLGRWGIPSQGIGLQQVSSAPWPH